MGQVIDFPPRPAIVPPQGCGPFLGVLAHFWLSEAQVGDPCLCGAVQLDVQGFLTARDVLELELALLEG